MSASDDMYCIACHGRGLDNQDHTCRRCKGSGRFLTTKRANDMNENTTSPTWVKGIGGLAELLQVSISTAKRIKKRGSLKKAIHQEGRTILTNAPLALELFGSNTGRHNTKL